MFTGALIDRLAGFHLNHPDAAGIFQALGGVFAPAGAQAGALDFGQACPGGLAAQGAPADLVQTCRATMALATRQGLIVTLCFYAWAGLHMPRRRRA